MIGLISCCPFVIIFTINISKTAKNILDKKAFTASTPADSPILQYLQVKKQKYQQRMTGQALNIYCILHSK